MDAIIDLLILLLIILTLVFSVKRGFVKTAIGALGFFIAAGVAFGFSSPAGKALAESPIGDDINSAVESAVKSLVKPENYTKVFGDVEIGEDDKASLEKMFSVFGAESVYEKAKEGYAEYREKGLESAREYITTRVSEKAVPFLCRILAFLLLFFGTRILLKLIEVVVGKLTELPVLKQANKLLGAVAGVLLAFLRVNLFCLALKLLLPAMKALDIRWISDTDLGKSVLYRLFDGGNFLFALVNLIKI